MSKSKTAVTFLNLPDAKIDPATDMTGIYSFTLPALPML